MKFEVLARTDQPNGFGKIEYILGTELSKGKSAVKVMAWTAKAGSPLEIGSTLNLYGGGSSTLFLGINWAAAGFEAALPHNPKPARKPDPCSHAPAHFVLHLFRDNSVRLIQVDSHRMKNVLEAIRQQWHVFGMRYDRYELGEWQDNQFVKIRAGKIYASGLGSDRTFSLSA